ncbi:ABC transporter permease subunit [Thermoflexus sp.]|uniref:ABC transporter permease subunit n=1 Tax=Thermoflexus sp. TaxID=1969742 RepID=UPI002ADE4B24|nr:ABC transporter permease subunit [Thermoflexus sp.]
MNIFWHEWKSGLRSLLIWSGVMALFILISVTKMAGYVNNPEMTAVLKSLPQAVAAAFGLGAFDLTTLDGFFGVMFVYFALMGAIAAATWGSGVLSREESGKTADFLLTLPVSRSRVLTAKALAALVNCLLFTLVTGVVSVLAVQSYQPDASFYRLLLLEMEAMFLIELIFLAIGLMLASLLRPAWRAVSVTIGLILASYFAFAVSNMSKDFDFLKYFTPFKYFDAAVFMQAGRLDGVYVLISLLIILASIAVVYGAYPRRDIYI